MEEGCRANGEIRPRDPRAAPRFVAWPLHSPGSMALRGHPTALGALLENVIQDMGLRPRIDATRVVETWAVLAGPQFTPP
mgnify:CR=1 FL=1